MMYVHGASLSKLNYRKLMSRIYDNWERLVEATLDREKLRELALAHSTATSFSSSISDNFGPRFSFNFKIHHHDKPGRSIDPIDSFKQECMELKHKIQQLKLLLHHASRVSDTLYDRPYHHITDHTAKILHMAVGLVMKCHVMKRVFTSTPVASFAETSSQVENCIKNFSWLFHEDDYFGSPPIAADEPVLCYIWELIAILNTGSDNDQLETLESLVLLVQDDIYRKSFIEEGGVPVLLKLLQRGKQVAQESAAKVIGLLGTDPERVDQILSAGTCTVFARVLKEGHTNVQAMVAWAASELVSNNPQCQYHFAECDFILLLMDHLFHDKNLDSEALARNENDGTSQKLDAAIYMKPMAARSLWQLAKGNLAICRIISYSCGLFNLALLLEQGSEEVQFYTVMAVMEISVMAEQDEYFRKSRFKPNSPVFQSVVKQLFRLIEMADLDLLVPCIRTVGNLARIFRATDTTMINPLVKLLDNHEVATEACIALAKFACYENFLHVDYSKAIIVAGGARRLVQLVYLEDETVQVHALVLLCYIALYIPESEIQSLDPTSVLEWALKQAHLRKDAHVKVLLPHIITRLNFQVVPLS